MSLAVRIRDCCAIGIFSTRFDEWLEPGTQNLAGWGQCIHIISMGIISESLYQPC